MSESAGDPAIDHINIPNIVGGSTAYVGFTAGGYYCILQQILNWTWAS